MPRIKIAELVPVGGSLPTESAQSTPPPSDKKDLASSEALGAPSYSWGSLWLSGGLSLAPWGSGALWLRASFLICSFQNVCFSSGKIAILSQMAIFPKEKHSFLICWGREGIYPSIDPLPIALNHTAT